jgi:hypothetical protein
VAHFQLLLERLAQCSQDDLLLSNKSTAGSLAGCTLQVIGASQSDLTHPGWPGIGIPSGYSQLVRFQIHREAFDNLCFDAPASEEFLFISDRAAFLGICLKSRADRLQVLGAPFCWRVLGWIRGKKALRTVPFHNAVRYPTLMIDTLVAFRSLIYSS